MVRITERSSNAEPADIVLARLTERRSSALTLRLMSGLWSEPLRVDKKLSNADSWREVHEEDQAALRPGLQDISISRT